MISGPPTPVPFAEGGGEKAEMGVCRALRALHYPNSADFLRAWMGDMAVLKLSDDDPAMLKGEHGPAARLAMSIVARMAEVAGRPS